MKKKLALILSISILAAMLIPMNVALAVGTTVDLDYAVKSNQTMFMSTPYFGPSDYVRNDDVGTISIKPAAVGGTVTMGYHATAYLDENLKITAKFGGTFSSLSPYVWDAFYLRSQGNGSNLPVGYWTLDKYMFTIPNSKNIQLYRMNNKVLTYLAPSSVPENVDLTVENEYELCATNNADSVDITLKINGVTVVSYSDTSADRITTAGYFGVAMADNDSTVTLGKAPVVADLNLAVKINQAYFTSPWPYFTPDQYIRTDKSNNISIKSSVPNGGIQMGYDVATYLNENIKISAKFGGGFSTGTSWDAFYLRSQVNGANPPVGGYSKDKYMFTIPNSKNIQLYRMNSGVLTYIAPSTVPANIDLTVENEYELCATNYADSVYVTLKINGVTVVAYNDTAADRIITAGYFGVADYGNNSTITLGKTPETVNMDTVIFSNEAAFVSPWPFFTPADYIRNVDNGTISIQSSTVGGAIQMGYQGASYLNENLKITAKFGGDFMAGNSWDAFYLRSKDNGYNSPLGSWAKDKYLFTIPSSKNIQLHRIIGGALTYLAPSTVPADIDLTAENEYELCAINYPTSVYITLKINGVQVISYNDTAADRITTAGYFGVADNSQNSTIALGKKPVTFTNYSASADHKITNLQAGTTVNNFLSRGNAAFSGSTTFVFKAIDNTVISSESQIGTGTTVNVTASNGEFQYTIVIYGDVTGDGNTSISDLLAIKKHILSAQILDGARLLAGDTTRKGSILVEDLIMVKKQLLKIATISQS